VCARSPQSSWWLLALLSLVLFFSARTVWGEEPNAPPTSDNLNPSAPSTPEPLPLTISGWQAFDEAWTSLQAELIASAEDSTKLSALLLQLQTELDELRSSLKQSDALLQSSAQALALERQAVAVAISDRNAALGMLEKSRALAAILGGIAGVSCLTLILSIVF